MSLALTEARRLADEKLQNVEAFVLIHSGRGNRRGKGWHIHILLVSGRWQKAWLYFVLWGKNVLQALHLRGAPTELKAPPNRIYSAEFTRFYVSAAARLLVSNVVR